MITRRQLFRAWVRRPRSLRRPARRPNVIVIMTDDQGYGDLSLHGNPHLKTPNIDRIGREGVQFTRFHVQPGVFADARQPDDRTIQLPDGRRRYVSRPVHDARRRGHSAGVPAAGRLSHRDFRQMAPGRQLPAAAMDQGFQEALTLRGGGLAQPSSPPGTGYFDPPLEHNGRPLTGRGYCTDIFFDAAQGFIEQNRRNPFFAYIACNAPHTPLEIGDAWVAPYRQAGLDDTTAKIYGMVANVDHNTGRLLGS